MSSLSRRLRNGFRPKATDEEITSVAMTGSPSNEKNATTTGTDDAISPNNENGQQDVEGAEKDIVPTEDAQRGVQDVEAVTLTWTKPYLIAVFIL